VVPGSRRSIRHRPTTSDAGQSDTEQITDDGEVLPPCYAALGDRQKVSLVHLQGRRETIENAVQGVQRVRRLDAEEPWRHRQGPRRCYPPPRKGDPQAN
jgi:hypothetical protein